MNIIKGIIPILINKLRLIKPTNKTLIKKGIIIAVNSNIFLSVKCDILRFLICVLRDNPKTIKHKTDKIYLKNIFLDNSIEIVSL